MITINKQWSKKEIKILKKSYENNESIKNICNKINRSESAIRNKAYKLGINGNNKWTKEEVEKLVKLYTHNEKRGNLELDKFAKEIGKLKSNICRKARQLGLTNQKRKLNNEMISKLKENGKEQWNKLTKEEKRNVKELFKWYVENEHPKGMLGKTHDEKFKNNQSKRLKERWENPNDVLNSEEYRQMVSDRQSKNINNRVKKKPSSIYSNSKQGKRKDLNDTYFRSSWEANYARYLNLIGVKWEYEPKTFIFEKIKRGTRSYTPDFYLTEEDKWIEIKGWFSSKDKTKLKRFKKYYPEEFKKLILVIQNPYKGKQAIVANELGIKSIEGYKEIKDKFSGLIDKWE